MPKEEQLAYLNETKGGHSMIIYLIRRMVLVDCEQVNSSLLFVVRHIVANPKVENQEEPPCVSIAQHIFLTDNSMEVPCFRNLTHRLVNILILPYH